MAAGHRPVSGKNPSAGPSFTKESGVWNVVSTTAVLRNTVTDADGDKSNLTFEVWTLDADGKPKSQVKLTDENPYGVLVSDFVASGKTAQVAVEYGRLKPGVEYAFRTSAFDGSLYETSWSPWAKFRISPYVTFPAPQSSSTIDPVSQEPRTVIRSEPGTAMAGRDIQANVRQTCSPVGTQGNKLCIKFRSPTSSEKKVEASPRVASDDLVPWCANKDYGYDYMNRTEVCLKDIGAADLIFLSSGKDDPPIGTASFYFEQRIKAYPTKGESGSDFAEFDQQLVVTPHHIDSALQGVNLYWKLGADCGSCDTSQVKWKSYSGGTDDGHFAPGEEGANAAQTANSTTKWTNTGKETIDLSWAVDATVDVGEAMTVSADFGGSGSPESRELAPRCDDVFKGSAPGCVMQGFDPVYTVDTNLYPAAGAYYWLMQQKMPGRPGTGDEPLHYLGPDTTVTNPSGKPWTSKDSRATVCPSTWTAHPADSSLGTPSCDEFAMASTHESGGFPGGPNQVTDGDECAQLFAGNAGSDFGIFADTRTSQDSPSWEKCGRATIPREQNSGAFHKFPAPEWRMLDNDAVYISNPGFEHCLNADTTCAWRKVG
ncbi:hypothetical protein [Streptomyces cacaoi]|uniref:hypothetical protein n=1 Tax=Streptomyces cacaoi TaxID=1898 RepID=UPI0037497FE6